MQLPYLTVNKVLCFCCCCFVFRLSKKPVLVKKKGGGGVVVNFKEFTLLKFYLKWELPKLISG